MVLVVKQSPYGVAVNVSCRMMRPSSEKVTLLAVEQLPMDSTRESPVKLLRWTHCCVSTRRSLPATSSNTCAGSLLQGAITSCVLLVVSRHTSAPDALTPCTTNVWLVQMLVLLLAGGSGGGGRGGGLGGGGLGGGGL